MSESEFVLWYINKIYLFTGGEFKRKYLIDEPPISSYKLAKEVSSSLNVTEVDGFTLSEFISKWYDEKRIEAKKDILDYIKFKYKVNLGYINWEITDMRGKKKTQSDIMVDFKSKYDIRFITSVIEEWFDNEVIRYNEKIFNDDF